jgi:hypothetical protein
LISCGIELSSSTAIFVILEGTSDDFEVVDPGVSKFELDDSESAEDVVAFHKSFNEFVQKQKIDRVAIKKRSAKAKGKYASGPITFKLEGLIQLCENVEVRLLSPNTIAAKLRKKELPEAKLFKYQIPAYETAFAALSLK